MYLEARRIDQNEKKISRERENLLRLLNTRDIYGPGGPASAGLTPGGSLAAGGPGSGIIIPSNSITIPSSSPASNGANGPISPSSSKPAHSASSTSGASTKKKKRPPKGSTQAEEAAAATAAAAAAAAASSAKGSSNNRRLSNSSINDGSSSNLPQGVQVKKEKLTPGAYLRSQKMTPIVSTKQQRLQATLVQLGLPLKPAMPTVNVMAKWDQLQNNIVTLLDLKKQVDKLESDLKVVKIRRGSASGLNLFPTSAGASAGGASGSSSSSALSSAAGSATSLSGLDGSHSVKREGTVDDTLPGQVKKKKRKE